jgi:hypothetical protein
MSEKLMGEEEILKSCDLVPLVNSGNLSVGIFEEAIGRTFIILNGFDKYFIAFHGGGNICKANKDQSTKNRWSKDLCWRPLPFANNFYKLSLFHLRDGNIASPHP